MHTEFLMGNEAIALGALAAGVFKALIKSKDAE